MNKENLVNPVERTETIESDRGANPLYTALVVSSNRKGSKYQLKESDRARGHYFLYNGLEVPFRAIVSSNNKLGGIVAVAFGTARDCPSQALGLCQLPSDSLCYARAGEKRATKRENENGAKGMDSYLNGLLCSAFWDSFETDPQTRNDFMDFLYFHEVEEVRFNLKGDFRHSLDCVAVYHLARSGFKMVGYTARDDLAECEILGEEPNIWVNGSNRMYTNRFRATDSLQEYLESHFRCIGDCSNCGNCYNLRGVEIVVLVHGAGSDTQLNNPANRDYLKRVFKPLGVTLTDEDFGRAKGLTTCLNKALALRGCPWDKFANPKEILEFIRANKGAII